MIKQLAKKVFEFQKRVLGLNEVSHQIAAITQSQQTQFNSHNQIQQLQLALQYQQLARSTASNALPGFNEVEFRVFSQNGEDGILLYIFSLIGATSQRCIEICAGDGIECNTANLIVNHGWRGLLFDGQAELLQKGRKFYAQCKDTWIWPPKLISAWITAENVNDLIAAQGFSGEVDLLSLDMDGVDWWIWKALETVKPRVVVAEIADWFPPDQSVTVPYKPDFQASYGENYALIYGGASLGAFVALAKKKGYRLIGCQRYGFNVFFMRNDIGQHLFPEISSEECYQVAKMRSPIEAQRSSVKGQEWIEVGAFLQ